MNVQMIAPAVPLTAVCVWWDKDTGFQHHTYAVLAVVAKSNGPASEIALEFDYLINEDGHRPGLLFEDIDTDPKAAWGVMPTDQLPPPADLLEDLQQELRACLMLRKEGGSDAARTPA